jgi:hypothetical protein
MKPFPCSTCNNRHNQIWNTDDGYGAFHSSDLVFICKAKQDPPKKGLDCSKWIQMTKRRQSLNKAVEERYIVDQETPDYIKELRHYGIDDMPGYRD